MKIAPIPILGLISFSLAAQILPLPEGSIGFTVTPAGPIGIGQIVTVTCSINNYRGTAEVDAFNFDVRYDKTRFAFVNGSFNTGTASGPDQQWLSKTNQNSAGDGYSLRSVNSGMLPGRVVIAMGDVGLTPADRGTRAPSGFLVSFQLQAIGAGSSSISLTQALNGSVLLDTSFRPVSVISFSSPQTMFVANPVVVSVQAVDSTASEPGYDSGAFLFTRTGPTNAALAADFTVGGTARAGFDYPYLGYEILIPAGASNATLVVTPMDDGEIEGDETVTLTLTPSYDYDVSGSATVVIHDDENPPPAVVLTNPANGTIFPQTTNITLTVAASDSNGSVTNVEFYREGTIKLGEDASSPYSFVWSNALPGFYVLTAKATDNLGATADSAPVSITVRGPPSVILTCPTNFAATASAIVTATATDPDGPIAFTEIYRNGKVFAATNGGTLTTVWTNAVPGVYTLTARVSDDRGLLSTSAPVVVTVTPVGLMDNYSNRLFITGFTNYIEANSTWFTHETGEPQHAQRNGDHSGWIAWTAPASTSVTMDTSGSSFDTVLAAYTNVPGTDNVANLVVVAFNDDADSFVLWSRVSFTAIAGKTYSIAVDSYAAGQGGSIQLHITQSNPAPVITASPQSVVANVGDNVAFSVSATGGTLSYQWRRQGTNLSGATASSLTLTNVALTSAGLYDVLVSNSGGSVASAPAVLVVRAPADFLVLPTNQVVNPGGTATFTATGTGTDPLNYQWSFKGVPMPGEVTNSYTRYNAQHADGGIYQVTVANAAGSASAGAELIVRPVFTSLTRSNNSLLLNWYGTTGKVYIVEGAPALNPPSTSWTTLGTVTNTALQAQFQVSLTNPPARVIRLRIGP